jgi:hypothetical protein
MGSRARLSRYEINTLFRTIIKHVTPLGNVYIADRNNNRIRKVTVSTGIITTIAGTGTGSYSGDNGPATSATLYRPSGVSLDASGNYSFIVIIVSNCM